MLSTAYLLVLRHYMTLRLNSRWTSHIGRSENKCVSQCFTYNGYSVTESYNAATQENMLLIISRYLAYAWLQIYAFWTHSSQLYWSASGCSHSSDTLSVSDKAIIYTTPVWYACSFVFSFVPTSFAKCFNKNRTHKWMNE